MVTECNWMCDSYNLWNANNFFLYKLQQLYLIFYLFSRVIIWIFCVRKVPDIRNLKWKCLVTLRQPNWNYWTHEMNGWVPSNTCWELDPVCRLKLCRIYLQFCCCGSFFLRKRDFVLDSKNYICWDFSLAGLL